MKKTGWAVAAMTIWGAVATTTIGWGDSPNEIVIGSQALFPTSGVVVEGASGQTVLSGTVVSTPAAPTSISWRTDYNKAREEASHGKRPLLVKVGATWCGPCRQMQELTFADSRVARRLSGGFVSVMVDGDVAPDVVSQLGIETFPTTILVAADGKTTTKLVGFQSAESLLTVLDRFSVSVQGNGLQGPDDVHAVSALATTNTTNVAFDGKCLVSLLEDSRIRSGKPEFSVQYRGQTVWFQTSESRGKFLADPERYWPVGNGTCLVSSRDEGRIERGDPRMSVVWRGRLWFFVDSETQKRFIQSPRIYVDET